MLFLRSTIFNILFYFWAGSLAIIHIPALGLPRSYLMAAMAFCARHVNSLLRWTVHVEIEERGKENLPEGPVIIAAKHQSAWETMAWLCLVKDPAIVMKSDLYYIPVYGQLSWKAQHIIVNRNGKAASLKKMLVDARRARDKGRPIVIFPQGTRTAPDATVKEAPYHPGVIALYRDLDIPVVPVATNSGMCWPRRKWLRYPGTIVVEYLPPIEPGLPRKQFQSRLEAAIEPATTALVAEYRAASKP